MDFVSSYPGQRGRAAKSQFPIVEDPSSEYAEGLGLYGDETMQRALCIDFDGVLNSYISGWQGHDNIPDPPVEGAEKACWRLFDVGWKLYVLTSRTNLEPVARWLEKYGFPSMTLTRVKPIAIAYIDDRAVRFDGNWDALRKLFV